MAKDIRIENDKIYIGKTAYNQILSYEISTYSTAKRMFEFKDKNLRKNIAATFIRGKHAVLIRCLCQMLINDGIVPEDCEIVLYRYSLLLIYTFISSNNPSIITSEIEKLLNDISISSLKKKIEIISNDTNTIRIFSELYNKNFENNKFDDYINLFAKELDNLKTKEGKPFNQYKGDIINSLKEDYYFFYSYRNQYDKKYGVFSEHSSFDRMISDYISGNNRVSFKLDFKTNESFISFCKNVKVEGIVENKRSYKEYIINYVGAYFAYLLYKIIELDSLNELVCKKRIVLTDFSFGFVGTCNFDASNNYSYFFDTLCFLNVKKPLKNTKGIQDYELNLYDVKESFEFDYKYFEEVYHIRIGNGFIEIN